MRDVELRMKHSIVAQYIVLVGLRSCDRPMSAKFLGTDPSNCHRTAVVVETACLYS